MDEKQAFKSNCQKTIKKLTNKSYPSLKNTKIHLKVWNQPRGSMMTFYFFGFWIFMDSSKFIGVSQKALRGVLAHELVHVEYFKQKNFLEKVAIGIRYISSPNFRKNLERETDRQTIKKGYGKNLLEFNQFRMRTASEKDRKFLNKCYLSDKEIKLLIKKKK